MSLTVSMLICHLCACRIEGVIILHLDVKRTCQASDWILYIWITCLLKYSALWCAFFAEDLLTFIWMIDICILSRVDAQDFCIFLWCSICSFDASSFSLNVTHLILLSIFIGQFERCHITCTVHVCCWLELLRWVSQPLHQFFFALSSTSFLHHLDFSLCEILTKILDCVFRYRFGWWSSHWSI